MPISNNNSKFVSKHEAQSGEFCPFSSLGTGGYESMVKSKVVPFGGQLRNQQNSFHVCFVLFCSAFKAATNSGLLAPHFRSGGSEIFAGLIRQPGETGRGVTAVSPSLSASGPQPPSQSDALGGLKSFQCLARPSGSQTSWV